MNATLSAFVDELRATGVPVSMVEALDAAEALQHTDLTDRENLRASLGATLVKNPRHYRTFDAVFDVFFAARATARGTDDGEEQDVDRLRDALLDSILDGDIDAMRRLVRQAVSQFAGMQPGRPVGGRYYTYRVMRQLDADELTMRLLAALAVIDEDSGVEERIRRDRVEAMMSDLRRAVDEDVTSRLVDERGPEPVAATRRVPLLEDIDLMHATRLEIAEIERAIGPLARRLATRLSHRRRHGRKGRLDVRRTIRRSLGYGGVLIDPQFKPPRVTKPEIVVLCDVSGSMATFARFTLQLTYAIASELSKVRSFAFIDGLDEVTRFFGADTDFGDALMNMSAGASLVRRDGHSDYGRSFEEFAENFADAVTPRTTLIVTGDARNNYRPTSVDAFAEITKRARTTFWLNPESRTYWDTGDSVMSVYAPHCDRVEQVRSLRQLERFVELAAVPRSTSVSVPA